MESKTPPQASSPPRVDDIEVSSRRISSSFGEVQKRTKAVPEAVENMGGKTPMETGNEGPESSDPRPDTVLETQTVPESGQQPPLQEEGRLF